MLAWNLESKVFVVAVAICGLGILRMSHIFRLSEREDVSLLFIIVVILTELVLRSGRFFSARRALTYLCLGLYWWDPMTPSRSTVDAWFKRTALFCSGGFFCSSPFPHLRSTEMRTERKRPMCPSTAKARTLQL
jgi:hypothetical protein